ncbi:MAG TPA: hypothetical protein DCO77_11170 [Nitrospiraceae bacterium]|nr:hypothetical protein [Nitrospiraceae bacterium]
MKIWKLSAVLFMGLLLTSIGYGAPQEASKKKRIAVVSSYHREYLWTQETNEGLCEALLTFGYFDNKEQITAYTKNDTVETSKIILKKLWLDSKRKKSKKEKARMTRQVSKEIRTFRPDLIFLGDDNAARYVGSEFLDAATPIVFWGINNTPVKYGIVHSIDRPGHNVTGVYQTGYYIESLNLLKAVVPGVKTFAILADGSTSGRSHKKKVEYLARAKRLPLRLVETVSTDDFDDWKQKALELQTKVDAFFLAQYSGLKDRTGAYVSAEDVANWYVRNIKIPEAAVQGQFVKQGMLCSADDSGYNQGYEAVVIAHDILTKGAKPATYPPRTPKRGALMVNRHRAKSLGITLTEKMGIERYVE